MFGLLALNSLKQVDIIFFIVLGAIIALCVIVYFLIPVFNKKQYKEQRDNLKKREVAFKSNVQRTDGAPTEESPAQADKEVEPPAAEAPAEPTENEEK